MARVTAAAAQVWLREAEVSDVRAVAEFQTRCWREAYRGLVPQSYLDRVTVADREVRWRERIVSGARWVALAESGGLLVGVVSWGMTDVPGVPALELKSLYVDRDHHGTGVAPHCCSGRCARTLPTCGSFGTTLERTLATPSTASPPTGTGGSIVPPAWPSSGSFAADQRPAGRSPTGRRRASVAAPTVSG